MKIVTSAALALSMFCAAAPAKAPVPRAAKELISTDQHGRKISVASLKGKVVVVQFLLTTCSHCQAMSRMLSRLQAEYGPKGFQAIGIAFNEANPAMVKAYTTEQHVTIPVGFASRETVLEYLGVSVMERLLVPQVVIIDRAGQVRDQSDPEGSPDLQDETKLRAKLDPLLAPVKQSKR